MKPRNKVSIVLVVSVVLALLFSIGLSNAQQATFQSPILVVNTSFLNVRTGPGIQYSVLVTVVGGTELPVLGVANDGVWYYVTTDGGPGWVNVEFTLPRGEFSHVPLVDMDDLVVSNPGQGGGGSTTGTSIGSARAQNVTGYSVIGRNIHAQPSFESLIVSSVVPNDPNTIYPLTATTRGSNGATWYYVSIPNIGSGWTDTVSIRPLQCGSDSVGVLVGEHPIRFDGISTQQSYLLPDGTEGYILGFAGAQNEFLRFELTDGTVGLIPAGSTVARTSVTNVCTGIVGSGTTDVGQGGGATAPSLTGNHVVINTGNLNVRSGPGAGYSVVATVAGGTKLIVLGRADDGVWYYVEGDFGRGWLNSQFTLFRGDYSYVPVIEDPASVPVADPATTPQNLGQGGGGAAPTGNVNSGRQVTGVSVIGRNMHTQPSYSSVTVSTNVPNDPNTIYPLLSTATTEGTVWYLVNVNGIGTGWTDAVNFRVLQCGSDQVGILNQEAPIRFDGFSTRQSYLLAYGTEGYIVGRQNDFTIFQLVDGTTGLVPATAISARSSSVVSVCTGVTTTTSNTTNTPSAPSASVTGNRVVVNTGNLNVRSGPGAAFSAVATVPGGTTLAVVGRASDGVWYLVEGTFGRGWLNSEFVLFRGDYSTVPVIQFGN